MFTRIKFSIIQNSLMHFSDDGMLFFFIDCKPGIAIPHVPLCINPAKEKTGCTIANLYSLI